MKQKEGVILAGLDIKMRSALIHADRIWRLFGQELWVTSGLEGEHSAGSLHYYGRAVDLRTRYFSDAQIAEVAKKLAAALGDAYDVVITKTHIHVEYDPKIDPTHKELARLLVYIAGVIDKETTVMTAQRIDLKGCTGE